MVRQTAPSNYRNLLIIVVDQLRYAYAPLLKETVKTFPIFHASDSCSAPTLTETMHASIATGVFPKKHGIISDGFFNQSKNKASYWSFDTMYKKHYIPQLKNGSLPLLASCAYDAGYQVLVFGGKDKTVKLMSEAEKCTARSWWGQQINGTYGFNLEYSNLRIKRALEKPLETLLPFDKANVVSSRFDAKVCDIAMKSYATLKNEIGPWAIFILFPALDYIGHAFGPGSHQVKQALEQVDSFIMRIYNETSDDNPILLITGDHGCRAVNTAIVLDDEKNPSQFVVYQRNNAVFKHSCDIPLPALKIGVINHISFDGGLFRIWLSNKRSISTVHSWLQSSLGAYISTSNAQGVDESLVIRNSAHDHLGDIFAFSKQNVAFFKHGWCKGADKIPSRSSLICSQEMPMGEHGSLEDDDRIVPLFMSENISGQLQQLMPTTIHPMSCACIL